MCWLVLEGMLVSVSELYQDGVSSIFHFSCQLKPKTACFQTESDTRNISKGSTSSYLYLVYYSSIVNSH